MPRVYHPYDRWEDFLAGMYMISDRTEEHTALSRELLCAPVVLLDAMRDVVREWPIAAENFLTAEETNRRAWLGAAACCWIHGAREHTVRAAWWSMSATEQAAANAVADVVLAEWAEARSRQLALWPVADA